MLNLKQLFVFLFFLAALMQKNYCQNIVNAQIPQASTELLTANVNVFMNLGVFQDSIVHIVWENYDEHNIKEVILESSDDAINFKQCAKSIIMGLMDIHFYNYPKELNYYKSILKSSEHDNIRFLYNDVIKIRDITAQPTWYRVKMITYAGFTYISQIMCSNGEEFRGNNTPGIHESGKTKNDTEPDGTGYSWTSQNKGGTTCPPVGTPPSGYYATTTTQMHYGDCCSWIERYYLRATSSCGEGWCCNDVPEAPACASGYAYDPCCVHHCSEYAQCSCAPWYCCSGSDSTWVVEESGSYTPVTPAPIASPSSYCGSVTSTLSASVAGATIYWYTGGCGTTQIGTGDSLNVTCTSTTTYYAMAYNASASCWSACGSVTVTIYPVPTSPSPTASPGTICAGSSTSLSASVSGSTIYWYTGSCGGTLVGFGSPIAVAPGSITTYFARAYNSTTGCYSTGCGNVTIQVSSVPTADAGTDNTFAGVPVLIGNPSNGPGFISWLPVEGLNNTTIAQPLASPSVTTTYTLTVNNNGCVATDEVTVQYVNPTHSISGKTMYMGRAYNGSPAPNPPTYNPAIYTIDRVIVLLKTYPSGTELARDTSDASGNYHFSDVPDGNYLLSYDKYTADTMQWGNDINVADVSMLKYLIASDTLQDPSRCFSSKYRKAGNVDNNLSLNVIDVSRIKSKIASPYMVEKNFPKGNWVALDKTVTVSGADVNINLETVCYGDYNASSIRYRDSLITWNGLKSLPTEIIVTTDEYLTTVGPSYIEIPLRISVKMDDFSALGLELTYPSDGYKLVNVTIPKAVHKTANLKINPTLEEIINEDNDLLVTDEDGVIRVVYATTDHFDVAAGEEIIKLGFRSFKTIKQGELSFELSGTGIIANKYGGENEEAYLLVPKLFVQGNDYDEGFEFSAYPNPFNDEAILNYSIPENGVVKLTVYNALGELVSELVNAEQIGGKHSALFSPAHLPAGVYTCRLEFVGREKAKSLVLKLIH